MHETTKPVEAAGGKPAERSVKEMQVDNQAIRDELKKSRRRHTVRVKSTLP